MAAIVVVVVVEEREWSEKRVGEERESEVAERYRKWTDSSRE